MLRTTSTRVALPLGAATAAATGEAAAGFSNSASGDSAGAASSTSVTVPEFARLFAGGRWIRTIGTPEREACFFRTLKFNGGILFGLTPAVPRQTLRWQLEYEVHF